MSFKLQLPFKVEKEKELQFPYEFAIIKLTETAKLKGVTDDFNKEVVHYQGGQVLKTYKYTDSVIKVLQEQNIPVVNEPEGEEFDFEEGINFGVIFRPHEL